MGGFVWQAMQGKLGMLGSNCFGRALSSGLWDAMNLALCSSSLWWSQLPGSLFAILRSSWQSAAMCSSSTCSFSLCLDFGQKLRASFSGILSTKTKGFGRKPGLKGQTLTPATCCRGCASSLGIAAMPGELILLPNLTFPRSLLSLPNSPLNSTPAVFCGKTDGSNK